MSTCIYTAFLPKKILAKTASVELGHGLLRVVKPEETRAGTDIKFTEEYVVSPEILDHAIIQKEVIFAQELSKIQRILQYKKYAFILPTYLFTILYKTIVCEKEKDLPQVLAKEIEKDFSFAEYDQNLGPYIFDFTTQAYEKKSHTYTVRVCVLESEVYARLARSCTLAKIELVALVPLVDTLCMHQVSSAQICPTCTVYLGPQHTEIIYREKDAKNSANTGMYVSCISYSVGEHFSGGDAYLRARAYAPIFADIHAWMEQDSKNRSLLGVSLLGVGAVVPGVRHMWSRELKCEISIQNPLAGIFDLSKAVPHIDQAHAHIFAAGIALFGIGKK